MTTLQIFPRSISTPGQLRDKLKLIFARSKRWQENRADENTRPIALDVLTTPATREYEVRKGAKPLTQAETRSSLERIIQRRRQWKVDQETQTGADSNLTTSTDQLKSRDNAFEKRIKNLRARNGVSRKRLDAFNDSLETNSPLAVIADELASIRELAEESRSNPIAGKTLIERTPSAIDRISLAASQLLTPARGSQSLKSLASGAAVLAAEQIRAAQEHAEEELDRQQGCLDEEAHKHFL